MKMFTKIALNLIFFSHLLLAQPNVNGTLDALEDFSTITSIPIEMPDGTQLMTDIYLPITSDSLMLEIDLGFGSLPPIELIPKGIQLLVYDSLENDVNPNPYQLPLIFARTPYNKQNELTGYIVNLLGYSYAVQDMRGRFSSEGVYFPMLSDSWAKTPYHPDFDHIADITSVNDPRNSNRHEDGYNSLSTLLEMTKEYDLDGDGIAETTDFLTNGNIGMFGASALGNAQYQVAATRPINPNEKGLKCLLPTVATNEHYKTTGYENGVFREALVEGWVRGQLNDLSEDLTTNDLDIGNSTHTPNDYNLENNEAVTQQCLAHFTSQRYNNGVASAYPNSLMRSEMDASFAPLNSNGQPAINGQFSRYQNMEVPMYHLSGWWDIFVNGQIDTYNKIMANLSNTYGNKQLQKLVIGPYAHQTTGSNATGDIIYKENATDIIGFNLGNIDLDNLDLNAILNSEVFSWYRYNLNAKHGLGEPKVVIPASNKWQDVGVAQIQIPSTTYTISLPQLINFLAGIDDLPPVKMKLLTALSTDTTDFEYAIPRGTINLDDLGLSNSNPVEAIGTVDFTSVPNVRFYVVGPIDDGVAENDNIGNYWKASDTFPLTNTDGIQPTAFYLTADKKITSAAPTTETTSFSYSHDPNNPVRTIGGGNMISRTPITNQPNQGQIDLSNSNWAAATLNNESVLQFTSPIITDSLSIIGFPKATIYASSTPNGVTNGPTDTDFFVRVLDVYPNGQEFFVVEGAVNARAREYAKSIAAGQENVAATYSNINSGDIYEYTFQLLPIAYTFGKGHQVKILISSSNYNRYQVNPNLPIAEGDFFRRKPNDGQTYTFNGVAMSPRIAQQEIFTGVDYPSHLELPIYTTVNTSSSSSTIENNIDLIVYPNPSQEYLKIGMKKPTTYTLSITNLVGQTILAQKIENEQVIDITNYLSGIYLISLQNEKESFVEKIVVE